VAVAHGGEIVWEEAFGWADREQRHPSADARGTRSTVHSLYSLGSISKPFTTTALMILVERSLIDLDAPANEYLAPPGIVAHVGDAREATVRRLADHTAGLPLHWHYFYDDERERPPPMEETIRRYGHLVTPPGERYQYANMGYGIVGHIVERVSGMPYAAFMRREVFAPLGLRHASVWIDPRLAAHTVKQYGADGIAYPPKVTDHPGAGSVWASVHDVMRFALFHLKQPQPDQAPAADFPCVTQPAWRPVRWPKGRRRRRSSAR
jgi:CubicO group peptidase (beta-lactamase class C family)